MALRVEISPSALEQIAEIEAWWAEHRPRAPGLFSDELGAAIERLADFPLAGVTYDRYPGVRRLLLRRSGYHLYTSVRGDVVRVVAVWSATSSGRPRL